MEYTDSGKKDEFGEKLSNRATGAMINAKQNVRIGASYSPSLPAYEGHISCIQYFKNYFHQSGYDDIQEYCDPSLTDGLLADTYEGRCTSTMVMSETT